MATLQKIRTKGPLLVIVIGLALFAFIAGDAWKILQPHQSQDVGEVNGDALSAQDFQAMVEEYTEVVKFSSGLNSLTDEQTNKIKDDVWQAYVNNKLIEKEAEKLGLEITDAEIQAMVNEGTDQLLMQTPFRNQQTGAFDKDMLNKFLVEYAKMDAAKMPAQYVEYYTSLYKFWSFIQKTMKQNRLAQKYQTLVAKSLSSNPVEAQAAFDARVNQADLLLAAIPYSTVADSTVAVKESELKALYDKKKEQFKQYAETRDIKYIDVLVTASPADREALEKEMEEYSEQLAATTNDYTSFIRSTGSEMTYTDLYYNKTAFPADVVARMDSTTVGEVYGPYYNVSDNTLNSFKVISKVLAPDSVEFRQIQVMAETPEKTKALADSIYTAIKGGAAFADLAKKYGQNGEPTWISSAQYEGAQLDSENVKFISAINSLGVNEMSNVAISQAQVILQVVNKKATKNKYKVAVIKRGVEFSKETYNKAYNEFSQFIASNPTLDKVEANAEDAGYKILGRTDLSSAEHYIGGVRGTKDALKWAFAAKPGEISGLYECGESDRMMMVALVKVNKEGYRSIEDVKPQLMAELIRDKKAEKIMAGMKAISSFDQARGMANVVTDSVKHVTFAAPAYIPSLRSSEPLVGAYASVGEVNKLSTPIKGTAGVLLMQVYAKEASEEQFDVKAEESGLAAMHARFASRLMGELYLKAKVKDARYLFF